VTADRLAELIGAVERVYQQRDGVTTSYVKLVLYCDKGGHLTADLTRKSKHRILEFYGWDDFEKKCQEYIGGN